MNNITQQINNHQSMFMQSNENVNHIVRHISRTSSQHSRDRQNNKQPEQQLQINGIKISRHQSISFAMKQFEQKNNKNNNSFQLSDGPDSNNIQNSKQGHQNIPEQQQQQSSHSQTYLTYKQMCKDIQFIQMLGNPRYVIQLFNRGFFYKEDFKEYIKKLKCFLDKPELMKLIRYPQGLYSLEQILKKGFVQSMQIQEQRVKFILRGLKKNLQIKSQLRDWRGFSMGLDLYQIIKN